MPSRISARVGRGLVLSRAAADISMPGLDGVQFYEWVRENQSALAERIIFLSGHHDRVQELPKDLRNRAVVKPFKKQQLRDAIEHVLRVKGRTDPQGVKMPVT